MQAEEVNTILLVDDDVKVLKAVKGLLELEGYRVEACHDPLLALQSFKSGNYDLVLSDIKMPEMDGIELLAQLREQDPDVPVILHTGYAELDSAVAAVKRDAFDYLLKPVEPEILIKAVERGVLFRDCKLMEKGYQQRLEVEVQAATADLFRMMEELKESRNQAMEASRFKSELLGNMSHELRTPLNHITGLAELLLEDEGLDSRTGKYLAMIDKSAWSLNRMLNTILDFSLLDNGQVMLREEDFNLDELLMNIRRQYEQEAREKGLELSVFRVPGVPVLLRGDGLRLEQVLCLLLDNALKFTEQGKIDINVTKANNDGGLLRFAISDTGCGIPDDRISCIFESFRQVDGSLTRKYGGAGLGLAVARKVVKLMGGEIEVKSKPDEGSVFSFTAKVKKQPA